MNFYGMYNHFRNLNEAYEIQSTLNPKIWNSDDTLREDVKEVLLEIYNEFLDFIEIPINVVDVELVGSNASYNYNNKSDLDLHIIVNNTFSYVDPTILQELYNSKKSSFNDKYDLSVNGVPVEVYIEDVKNGNATNGIYSLLKEDWIRFPEPMEYDIPDVSDKVEQYKTKYKNLMKSKSADDILNFINEVYLMRKIGLAKEGEMSEGNLVFKQLRNENILSDLKDRYYEIKSDELSM